MPFTLPYVLIPFTSSLHGELRLLMCASPNPTVLKLKEVEKKKNLYFPCEVAIDIIPILVFFIIILAWIQNGFFSWLLNSVQHSNCQTFMFFVHIAMESGLAVLWSLKGKFMNCQCQCRCWSRKNYRCLKIILCLENRRAARSKVRNEKNA